jgi:hypothetical protein
VDLPKAFCWTKYGDEAGEPISSILRRKEAERAANDGLFLWGIGTSIRPSLLQLLPHEPNPTVIFSPMLSAPAARDVSPPAVVAWRHAHGLDGKPFELPGQTTVTSRLGSGVRATRHYALVCHSSGPLVSEGRGEDDEWIDDARLRNFTTGRPLGHSQVTSVVKASAVDGRPRPRYQVGFRATLRYPYLVELSVHRAVLDLR